MPKFDFQTFKKDCLVLHNKIREEYGAPPLENDEELLKIAKDISKNMCKSGTAAPDKSHKGLGQLIMVLEGQEPCGESILKQISETGKSYDFNQNECPEDKRHFAQVVWVDSVKFGCSVATSNDGKHYIVFLYKPAGNVVGNYQYNVLPKGTAIAKRNQHTARPVDNPPDDKQIAKEMIKYHNEARSCHSASNLEWDSGLAKAAKKHASQLLSEKKSGKELSKFQGKYGRNTLIISGMIPSISTCCKKWYQTSAGYDYESNTFQPNCSSFTQMVWYDSKKMGAAYANDGDICIVVALYSPAGNVSEGYKRNVSRPPGDKVPLFEE